MATHSRSPASNSRGLLLKAIEPLGADELHVLMHIARRLQSGLAEYGALDLARDIRDFRGREAREEIEDFLVYMACAWLKALAKSKGEKKGRPAEPIARKPGPK